MELLVPKLYDFFDYQNDGNLGRTLFEFVESRQDCFFDDKYGYRNINMGKVSYISSICRKMAEDNLLIRLKTNGVECFNDVYFVNLRPDNFQYPELFSSQLAYGYYDFAYNGFPFTRAHFTNSVVPVIGINKKGDYDIGTAYYIDDNEFVTAAHCITGLNKFSLQYQNGKRIKVSAVLFPDNDNIDLAIIKSEEDIQLTPFMLGEPGVLDDILVMGYPPIPGMDTVLISETGTVNTFITPAQKASDGQIIAETKSYLPPMDYFMINCRVKGGNSGGPVINKHGLVIGTVVSLVFDSKGGSDGGRYDLMGFGTCISSEHIPKIHENHTKKEFGSDGDFYFLK